MKYFISYAISGLLGFLLLSIFSAEIVRLLPAIPWISLLFFWGCVFLILGILVIITGTQKMWESAILSALSLAIIGGFLGYFI
jgi:hypothetical protein